jgi:hypothetical protein
MEKENQAYLFAARGGAHKTRTAMDGIRSGKYRLIGDDRIILGKYGIVLSYPLFYDLIMFRVENLQDEFISSFLDRLRMTKYLYSHRNKENTEHVIADKSQLKKLFLVARKCGCNDILKRRINLDDASHRMVSGNQMEMISSGISSLSFVHFLKYMQAYSYVLPDSTIATYWDESKKMLEKILNNVPIYEIDIPQKYTTNTFKKISMIMEDP